MNVEEVQPNLQEGQLNLNDIKLTQRVDAKILDQVNESIAKA